MINTEIDELTSLPLVDNKNLKELLFYNGVCYWWFIDFTLHNHITRNKNLKFGTLNNYYHKLPFSVHGCIEASCNYAHKCIESIISHTSHTHNTMPKNPIFYFMLDWEWRFDIESGKYKNIYHSDIINNLPYSESIVSYYDIGTIKGLSISNSRRMHKPDKIPNLKYIDNKYYWSISCTRAEFIARKHFQKVWEIIKDADSWFEQWHISFPNIPASDFKYWFMISITYHIPKYVGYYECKKRALKSIRPKAIVMRNEQMVSGRSLVYAAKYLGIPTIGIQHGPMVNHPAYLCHNPNDVFSADKNIQDTAFPIPDVTCVWGEAEYSLLTVEAGYPENQVVVTGNPRYDYLHFAQSQYSRSSFCKKHDINIDDKIILWTTQSHGFTLQENHAYLDSVFSSVSQLSGVTLIVKQHPNEPDTYTQLIQEYIKTYSQKISVVFPDKMDNTTEMVFISDVVINCFSTTGQEAIAFHKPMIILDFSDNKDLGDYVKEGVGIPVYNPDFLLDALVSLLEGEFDAIERQNLYVRNHMYKLDGLSAERVAKVIMNQIGNT